MFIGLRLNRCDKLVLLYVYPVNCSLTVSSGVAEIGDGDRVSRSPTVVHGTVVLMLAFSLVTDTK
jgi:hypothetical protein